MVAVKGLKGLREDERAFQLQLSAFLRPFWYWMYCNKLLGTWAQIDLQQVWFTTVSVCWVLCDTGCLFHASYFECCRGGRHLPGVWLTPGHRQRPWQFVGWLWILRTKYAVGMKFPGETIKLTGRKACRKLLVCCCCRLGVLRFITDA